MLLLFVLISISVYLLFNFLCFVNHSTEDDRSSVETCFINLKNWSFSLKYLFCSKKSEAPSKHKAIMRKFWAVSEEVDKTLLRQEVQEFCGQFPVFRLQEVNLGSAAAGFRHDVKRTRFGKYLR